MKPESRAPLAVTGPWGQVAGAAPRRVRLRRPRAAAVAAALLLHAALTLAALHPKAPWAVPAQHAATAAASASGAQAREPVLWVRALPQPVAAPTRAAAPAVAAAPPADAGSGAAGTAAARGPWAALQLWRGGLPLQLDLPDLELPASGVRLVLELQLDDARQVTGVSGAADGLRGTLRRHAEDVLLGTSVSAAGHTLPQRVCMELRFDPTETVVRWRAFAPPPGATPCPPPGRRLG